MSNITHDKVCYNVTVGYPVPEKKCENKIVKLPKVKCDEVEVSLHVLRLSGYNFLSSGGEMLLATIHF